MKQPSYTELLAAARALTRAIQSLEPPPPPPPRRPRIHRPRTGRALTPEEISTGFAKIRAQLATIE
jgi:hypothetical protein